MLTLGVIRVMVPSVDEVCQVAWASVMQGVLLAVKLGVLTVQQAQLLEHALRLSCPCLCPRCLRGVDADVQN